MDITEPVSPDADAPVVPPFAYRHPRAALMLAIAAVAFAAAGAVFYIIPRYFPHFAPPIRLKPPAGIVELTSASEVRSYRFSLSEGEALLTPATSTASTTVARSDGTLASAQATASGPVIEIRTEGKTRSAGAGRPLAVLANGAFLAATPSGIIAVDPHTLATTSVIATGSLITAAQDARFATVNRITGSVDMYGLSATTSRATYQYSISVASTTAVSSLGFDGPDYLIVNAAPSAARLYHVPADGHVIRLDPIVFSSL